MSKDAPATPTSPQLLVPPATNMPFSMAYPFPVLQPAMGQYMPMGMLPIDGNTIQHYMELATKRAFHPAMMAPMFALPNIFLNPSGDKLMDDAGNSSSPAAVDNQTQSVEQVSGNFIPMTQSSSSTHPVGGSKTPVMPISPMFFLPFSPGGAAGYLPNYPNFNVHTPSTNSIDIPKDDSKPGPSEKEDVLPRRLKEDQHSDELDVAKILVDMQVPVLKQVPAVTTARCNEDSREATNMSNEISSPPDVIMSSEAPTLYLSGVDGPASPDDTPSSSQHCREQVQNDKQQGEISSSNLEMNEGDQQASEELELKDSSDPNDRITPGELQLENTTLEETSGEKLEVIGEGESMLHAQSMDITGLEQTPDPDQLASSNVQRGPSEERTQKSDQGLLELLQSIKNEVPATDVSSDQNSVEQLSSQESPTHLTSDVIIRESREQIIADSAGKKCESLEERKEQDELEKNVDCEVIGDDAGTDENGVLKKTYKCDVCSQLFRSPLGLQKHIEFHMDDGKHYTCSICFMHFCNDNALQEHQEKHTRKRPHKCEFCPKAFRDPGSLQKHVRVHTGEKPYKCKDCPRSFAEYSSLRKHQRVHTGEQPYKCQYCSKAFSISGNLQRHILIHTGERPYKCNFCTKAFNNPSHLRRHVKNLHFKGDSAIDEAMLSHYGNPATATKNAEQDSSPEAKLEETGKPETQQGNNIETSPLVSADGLKSVPRNVVIQAL